MNKPRRFRNHWALVDRMAMRRCDGVGIRFLHSLWYVMGPLAFNATAWRTADLRGRLSFGTRNRALQEADKIYPIQCQCSADQVLLYDIERARKFEIGRIKRMKNQGPPLTPVCDQLSSLMTKKRLLEDFIEWCHENQKTDLFEHRADDLIYEFLEIDKEKLEQERRALLGYQRVLNGEQE